MDNILTLSTGEGKKDFYVMKVFDVKSRTYIALMPLFGDKVGIWFYRYEKDKIKNRTKIYDIPSKGEFNSVKECFDNEF